MSFNSNDSDFDDTDDKFQMLVHAQELKIATSTLNSLFAQLLSVKSEAIRKELLKQISQIISGMIVLMKDLNSFKTLLNFDDQKLLDALSETFNQYFLDLKYLTLEKSAIFESELTALHNNVSKYSF